MSKQDLNFDQFVELLSALEEGELSEFQQNELTVWLSESDQARASYYDYVMLQALLRRKAARVQGTNELSFLLNSEQSEITEEPNWSSLEVEASHDSNEKVTVIGKGKGTTDSPSIGFLARASKFGNRLIANPMKFSLSIALITIVGLLLILAIINPFSEQDDVAKKNIPAKPEVVALVTYESDCRWASRSVDKIAGKSLSSGDEIELFSGVAEIMFTSGVKVIIKGPTTFGFETKKSGRLYSGKLTATVPKKAVGFTIHTPYAAVVDLGTRFAVSADSKKGAYVYVKEGKVEVGYTPSGSNNRTVENLTAGQAFQVKPSGEAESAKPQKEDARTFVFSVTKHKEQSYSQAVLGDRPLAYWRLNEKSGRVAKDSSGNNHHAKYEGDVKLGFRGPLRSSRTTSALFDGQTAYVALPVLGKASQLTMEAWVQLDQPSKRSAILIATNKNTGSPDGSLHWQFNASSEMIMEAKKGGWRTTGFSKSFTHKNWHHVVLTYDSDLDQVKLFVNGKLLEEKNNLTIVPANLGKSLIGGGYHRGLYLSGKIAEVALYRKVLTAKQIAKHYRASL